MLFFKRPLTIKKEQIIIVFVVFFFTCGDSIFTKDGFCEPLAYGTVLTIKHKLLKKGNATVEIFLSKAASIRHHRLDNPYLVYIDILNTTQKKRYTKSLKRIGSPVTKIRSAQNREGRVRVVIQMVKNARYIVEKHKNRPQIVVRIKDTGKRKPEVLKGKKNITLPVPPLKNNDSVLNQAGKALDSGQYSKAIILYTKGLDDPIKAIRKTSLKRLGFAREQNGQIGHARAEYKKYISLYPKDKQTGAIRKRLAELELRADKLDRLMTKANKALTGGKYREAVQLYTKILSIKNHRYRQKAQEFLGVAREKGNQIGHAQAEYKKYLKLYPKGEGADRVMQRLAGLETARSRPPAKLRKVTKKRSTSLLYGSFSQFYNWDDSYVDSLGVIHNISSLSSNMSLSYRNRGENYAVQSLFIGGYDRDFLDEEDSVFRLSRFYFDILDKKKHIMYRAGRQQKSGWGVLGRFDGGVAGMKVNKFFNPNIVAGLPVDTTKLEYYDTSKHFYGINFDLGPFYTNWDYNLFFVNQEADGITDRRAMGGEINYLNRDQMFFSYFDYDIYFNEVNTILFSGGVTLPKEIKVNFSIDYRKSPLLTLSNAIIGQGVDTVGDLKNTKSISEIGSLAKDRTATSKSILIGLTHSFNKKIQISGDVTLTDLTGTRESGGVEAYEGTGVEYYYNLQLIGNNLIIENDIAILGVRFIDASTSDTYSFTANSRYPYTRNFRINPRVRIDYRKRNREDRFKIRPSVRLDYRWKKRMWFELNTDVEYDKNLTDSSDTTATYSFSIGYRLEY